MWKREDLMWAVGLFEGEGTITRFNSSSKNSGWELSIKMTDLDVLEKFHNIIKLGKISYITSPSIPKHWKKTYRWRIRSSKDVYAVLVAFYPFLGNRRKEKALQVIEKLFPKEGVETPLRYGTGLSSEFA